MLLKLKSKFNGAIHYKTKTFYDNQFRDWEILEEPKEEEVVEEDKEISYKEIKEILKHRGVTFKGNASKEDLIKLLDES